MHSISFNFSGSFRVGLFYFLGFSTELARSESVGPPIDCGQTVNFTMTTRARVTITTHSLWILGLKVVPSCTEVGR